MERIKVCFVINRLSNAGPVSVIYNLVSNIDLDRFDVYIITISPENKDSQVDRFLLSFKNVYYVPAETHLSSTEKFLRFKKLIRAIKPNVIHSHCARSLAFSIILRKNYKVFFTYHNYPGPLERVLYGSLLGNLITIANSLFSKMADKVVTCSESISNDLLVINNRKVDYISNGVSFPVWDYSLSEKKYIKTKLGLKQKIRYFIAVGRLSPEKNMSLLVKAFNAIDNLDIGLILLGDGEEYDYLNSINKSENVILAGHQTDVRSYLIASDFYVSASNGEGLSMAMLESMSVGLPMLLSDISSHRMILSKFDTSVGYIFDKSSKSDLIEKMKVLMDIDICVASDCIKKVYEQMFTSKVMAENYSKQYEILANRIKKDS